MWRRRSGTLRGRRYTALSASAWLCTGLCASAALCVAANDEHALRQALTIVQLLRAEFSRSVPRLTETPAPTCAPTTTDLLYHSDPSRRHWNKWYKAAPQRRLDYEDAFGAHPSMTASPEPITSTASTATSDLSTGYSQDSVATRPSSSQINLTSSTSEPILTTALSSARSLDTSISAQTASLLTTPFNLLESTHAKLDPTSTPVKVLQPSREHVSKEPLVFSNAEYTSRTSALHIPEEKTLTLKTITGTKKDHFIDTVAPELQQAAVELADELESSEASRPMRLKRPVKSKRPVKTKRPAAWRRPVTSKRPRPRPSWHEHLARSTRYPVPLPENHAFCFTDPHNALCGTFI